MKWWHKVLVGVAVIAVVAVVAAVTVATAGAGSAAACIAVSALTGAIKGAAIGAVTGAVMGGAIGAVSGAIQTGTWEGAFQGLVSGAIDGAASGFMMGAITGAISGALNPKFCFVAGTLVLTEQGLKAIEEIKVGDKVASTNSNTGEKSFKEVLDVFINKHKKLIDIKIGDEIITTTPDHPFYVNNLEWKMAGELKITDTLQNDTGEILDIVDVAIYEVEEEIEMYNFEVEEFHTYFVGQNQVFTHNKCLVDENGVKVEGYYPRDHGPAHVHVYDGKNSGSIKLLGDKLVEHKGRITNKAWRVINKHSDKIIDYLLKVRI